MIACKLAPVILIVEDEALVRLSAVDTLEGAGFRMLEAASSDEALEFLAADFEIQLLFTDVNMPGPINGLVLARQMRDRWPHIGIIIASANRVSLSEEMPADARFERKPYSLAAVVRHARELTLLNAGYLASASHQAALQRSRG